MMQRTYSLVGPLIRSVNTNWPDKPNTQAEADHAPDHVLTLEIKKWIKHEDLVSRHDAGSRALLAEKGGLITAMTGVILILRALVIP